MKLDIGADVYFLLSTFFLIIAVIYVFVFNEVDLAALSMGVSACLHCVSLRMELKQKVKDE